MRAHATLMSRGRVLRAALAASTLVALAVGVHAADTAHRAATPPAGVPVAAATPAPSTTAAPYSCATNGPPGGQTVYGTFGDAGLIGWAGNNQGVVACLGGSFFVISAGSPGDGTTTPVQGTTYGYGVYDDSRTTWRNAEGYLPALVTSFERDGAHITITNFGDRVTIGGHAYVVVYSRVRVQNPTRHALTIDPQASDGLVDLHTAPNTVPAHGAVNHDYAVPSDRFGGDYAMPTSAALAGAGGFDAHYTHMRSFWNAQLAAIATPTQLPDQQLVDAYKSGFVYTQIIRSGAELKTGINGYDVEFSHDVIGILANLINQGYNSDIHGLLDRARRVTGTQSQYSDGVWTYPWVWALYLEKTGDLAYVKANFATEGPGGAKDPSIKDTAHAIAAQRTGPGGIMEQTSDIDANGYWTIDNYEALTGLTTYRYLAAKVGDTAEVAWATKQYDSLLAAVNKTLNATIAKYKLHYLPCSMIEPNTANRCGNAEDANWGAPFLFGRWAWDGYLFGARIAGPGSSLIDATYNYGFGRLRGKVPPNTLGGYPTKYFSTAYNAGYGEWGLASTAHRDQGVLGYQFMVAKGQSGPYSWWESQQFPNPGSPWVGTHPADGNGSAPHAWGIANANLVLLDSLVAQRSDGSVIVGRGVPNSWVHGRTPIAVANVPTGAGPRLGVRIVPGGKRVTLRLSGPTPGAVLFQLPAFVANVAHSSAGRVDQHSGTVTLPRGTRTVTVTLRHAPR